MGEVQAGSQPRPTRFGRTATSSSHSWDWMPVHPRRV